MHDAAGRELHAGDIVFVSTENQQVLAHIRKVENAVDNGVPIEYARVSILKYATGKNPMLKYCSSVKLVWYTSEYAGMPETYIADLLVSQGTTDA